ncbi:MAG: Acetylornithine deacetylase/Succinyl-diaminopimelate desuccinylase and related deacylases [uncultured Sulfurovum sp.]|uniref:Acetylornithine deacetylase/Succinyl-diaminopimelate desuccinylase and related deacylases n=1 Tax=uncultured Sulfurovum sp. TaxID=269237 RepID=A0A6S6T3W3_9BACT|nr:MAG: Acetylornithine deacetylase/Succinyl-diaminopimelate desuccinylase and related deacylases [uncultured Sulfurovum sp.]
MPKQNFDELKQIIEINSWTKNKAGVDKNGEIFALWMESLGYKQEVYEREEIGNHLHFISEHKEGKKLLLLGHLDTVFPPDTFEEFKEDEQWIYGPGVCDMKGGNFVALEALRHVYQKFGNIANIDFLLVSDEETGSDDSKYLSATLAKDYDYCMVFEAAGRNDEVVIGRKGVGTFFIDIEGKAAHAGNHYSDGADANLEAAQKLMALVALTNLEKETTVNVGKISGGIGANTISPKAHLTFELRYTSTNERDRVLKAIDKIVLNNYVEGTSSMLSGGIQRDVMQPSTKQREFIEHINKLCNINLATEKRGGVSDANVVSAQGVATLDGWGPFGDGDHTIHERASKQSFIERINLVSEILEHFSEGGFEK